MSKNIANYKYKKYKNKYLKGGELSEIDITSLLQVCFSHQIQIKMLHFQTKKYNVHKILDDYLSCFNCRTKVLT